MRILGIRVAVVAAKLRASGPRTRQPWVCLALAWVLHAWLRLWRYLGEFPVLSIEAGGISRLIMLRGGRRRRLTSLRISVERG